MGQVVALSSLLEGRQVWQGRSAPAPAGGYASGWPTLDAVLPNGGWPEATLSEILLPCDGVGELQLVLPALARLSAARRQIAVIAPPYAPCVAGWERRGVSMAHVDVVHAPQARDALWASEQCLRSGSYAAVLCWPHQADDRALRRLQVAADSGRALGFIFRDRSHAVQASPAALRLELETEPTRQIRVRKCRGSQPPAWPIPFPFGTP
ncbi:MULTISPECIES: translesion DNA synthesis-associated protein ImuA [Dyella]|uniref:Translesion DNA synthesis-associated protein ImuA n=2 Tax=Dyella TaxID=231454 RepID=A0A4R0YRV7_9GAMM|nr:MULTISPECIES: translesion DNA synthesis-associated protein ImuA [Dyella]TBR40487.1 translesion DNA synthesis-associated protein ImuA [Dyella terrae]TCI11932.1 translesion DNA synthesis-associated protein ImuA [Dyella soli]